MNRTIMLSSNTAWSIVNFRSGLIRHLQSDGYSVVAVAPHDAHAPRLIDLGCRFIDLPMDNHGTHPGRDMLLLARYLRLLKALRPSVYLGYTVKPNVYGSLAAHALRIPVVNNIAGLGSAFVENNLLTRIVQALYKCSLRGSERVFFQNGEDRELFIRSGLVGADSTDRLPGSGVDLSRYPARAPSVLHGRPFRFLLVARVLRSKGIVEYVEAARAVRRHVSNARFQLLGFVEKRDRNAIPVEDIRAWEREGVLDYLGGTDDVVPFLAEADCVVLPSYYREGVPRALLEAAAMARPLIASDAVGCRDAVDDGINGFLCKPKNANDLAQKMLAMIRLDPRVRIHMGMAGRRKVEAEFDERLVLNKYSDVIRAIEQNGRIRQGRQRTGSVSGGREYARTED